MTVRGVCASMSPTSSNCRPARSDQDVQRVFDGHPEVEQDLFNGEFTRFDFGIVKISLMIPQFSGTFVSDSLLLRV